MTAYKIEVPPDYFARTAARDRALADARSLTRHCANAIRAALEGKTYLTPQLAGEVLEAMKQGSRSSENPAAALTLRQREVLQLLAEGKTNKEVGQLLGISVKTAMSHREHVMEKLDLHSRTELIRFAIKQGIIRVED